MADDMPLTEPILTTSLIRASEEELSRCETEQGGSPADTILRALEAVIGSRLGRVVGPEDREVVRLTEFVEPDKPGRVKVILVRVNPEEDDEWIDYYEVTWKEQMDQPLQLLNGICFKVRQVNRRVIDEGPGLDAAEVQVDK